MTRQHATSHFTLIAAARFMVIATSVIVASMWMSASALANHEPGTPNIDVTGAPPTGNKACESLTQAGSGHFISISESCPTGYAEPAAELLVGAGGGTDFWTEGIGKTIDTFGNWAAPTVVILGSLMTILFNIFKGGQQLSLGMVFKSMIPWMVMGILLAQIHWTWTIATVIGNLIGAFVSSLIGIF